MLFDLFLDLSSANTFLNFIPKKVREANLINSSVRIGCDKSSMLSMKES